MKINKIQISNMLDNQQSQLYDGPMEGVYLRIDSSDGHLLYRAKIVRKDFVQSIDRHWSKHKFVANTRER